MNNNLVRLQKFIADSGYSSRRKAETLILDGKVSVNREIVRELGAKVDPGHDRVFVEGEQLKPARKFKYFIFYKPAQVVTTMEDPQGRPTVARYIEHLDCRVYPVGRLDYHSEGLLLFTNHGELAHKINHPRFKISKEYLVKVKGFSHRSPLSRLRKGVRLEDGPAKAEKVSFIERTSRNSWISVTISEGRNRQVRRMLRAVGLSVLKLKRNRYGPLYLDAMKPGELRELTRKELADLINTSQKS